MSTQRIALFKAYRERFEGADAPKPQFVTTPGVWQPREDHLKNKTFVTRIPVWEGETMLPVTAPSEQEAAIRRGELEVQEDPTVAGCFESGIEIEVVGNSSEDEPSHFRVYTTDEPTFHAQRTDDT